MPPIACPNAGARSGALGAIVDPVTAAVDSAVTIPIDAAVTIGAGNAVFAVPALGVVRDDADIAVRDAGALQVINDARCGCSSRRKDAKS